MASSQASRLSKDDIFGNRAVSRSFNFCSDNHKTDPAYFVGIAHKSRVPLRKKSVTISSGANSNTNKTKKRNSGITGQDKRSNENSEKYTKVTRKVLGDLSNLGGNTLRPTLPGNNSVDLNNKSKKNVCIPRKSIKMQTTLMTSLQNRNPLKKPPVGRSKSRSVSSIPSPEEATAALSLPEEVETKGLKEDTQEGTSIFRRPFTDLQQVQLRAQIFVYGALMQGHAPDEAYMISAFGDSNGGKGSWEKAWRACAVRAQKMHVSTPGTSVQSRQHTTGTKKMPVSGESGPSTLNSLKQTELIVSPLDSTSTSVPITAAPGSLASNEGIECLLYHQDKRGRDAEARVRELEEEVARLSEEFQVCKRRRMDIQKLVYCPRCGFGWEEVSGPSRKKSLKEKVKEVGSSSSGSVILCADSDFTEFEKWREEKCFKAGQTWAMYDDMGLPRYYAKISRVIRKPTFMLMITWLEANPVDEKAKQWVEKKLPLAVGKFKEGRREKIAELKCFSHVIFCREEKLNFGKISFSVYPCVGETWALFRNWDISWSSGDRRDEYEYDFVEILSEYAEGVAVEVALLRKVKGFTSVFCQTALGSRSNTFQIPPHELLRFSHNIPSTKLTGREGKGVPVGSYELDTAAIPQKIEEAEEEAAKSNQVHHRSPPSS